MGSFIGRDVIKSELREKLLPDASPSRKAVVLQGPAGIGKTELLLHLFGNGGDDGFSRIFWLDGSSRESIIVSLACIYPTFLQYPRTLGRRPKHLARNLLQWLEEEDNTEWLLIFDGLGQTKDSRKLDFDIEEFLPDCAHGSVLVTTRYENVDIGDTLTMDKLSTDEAIGLLHSSAKINIEPDMDPLTVDPDLHFSSNIWRDFPTLLLLLDAISTKSSPSRYLELLKQTIDQQSCDSLTATFALTYRELQERAPLSARLLALTAYYYGESFWHDLIADALEDTDRPLWLSEITYSTETFRPVIFPLLDLSLLKPKPEPQSYLILPALRSWLRDHIPHNEATEHTKLVLRSIGFSVPQPLTLEARITQLHLFHQLNAVYDALEHDPQIHECTALADAFMHVGHLLMDNDEVRAAEYLYKLAIAGYRKGPGSKRPFLFHTIDSLGLVYERLGQFDKAEDMFKEALEGFTDVRGPDSPAAIQCWYSLGGVYEHQKRFSEAEEMYKRSLKGFRQKVGGYHRQTTYAVDKLVGFYEGQKRPEDAEGVFEQTLYDFKEEFGSEYASIIDTMVSNSANLFSGRDPEFGTFALEPHVKAAIRELGPDHLPTFMVMKNFGIVYCLHGKLVKAAEILWCTLTGTRLILSSRHSLALNMQYNLAFVLKLLGEYHVAEEMFQQIIDRCLELVKPRDGLAIDSMNQLDDVRARVNGLASAEGMEKELTRMDRRPRIRSRP